MANLTEKTKSSSQAHVGSPQFFANLLVEVGIEINKKDLAEALKTMTENESSSLTWLISSDCEDVANEGTLTDVLDCADIGEKLAEKAKKICLSQGIVWIFPSYYNSHSNLVKAFVEGDPTKACKRSERVPLNFLTVRSVTKKYAASFCDR